LPSERLAARCEDLVKTYRTATSSVDALRGISAGFPEAALTAVAGPSGSGKSSLLRLVAGLDRPTSGTLSVGDLQLQRARARAVRRLRRTVGYTFQRASDNFFPHLTVREHLLLAVARSRAVPKIRPDELPDLLGLAHRLDHLPAELSGGEQARAALAQVVAGGVSIVVADEPTAELDSASADEVLRVMRVLVEREVTIIAATHDRSVIRRADHLIELDHGLLRKKSRTADGPSASVSAGVDAWGVDGDERRTIARASRISKSYRRGDEVVHAVRDASVELQETQLVGLVGRSGSGKTTLLNILAGWERPDEGAVAVVGHDPSSAPPPWKDVAVVPQRLGLMDELTIRENVEYPARLTGSLSERARLVEELLDAFGLVDLQGRFPKEISVGEQQRAALARAMVLSPRLLLADEPAGHQDAGWAAKVFQALRRGVEDGTCCLAATHDETVVEFVDRVLSMSDGTPTEVGPPRS
jgi:putative ABC transport system ATP-binding protein